MQKEKLSVIEFEPLIFSSMSESFDLAEENSERKQLFLFFFVFIYPIYFWPDAENLYYVPFPWRRQDTVI